MRDYAVYGTEVVEHREPTLVTCPACKAGPSAPCTAPTDTGRRTVTWVHQARECPCRACNQRRVRKWEGFVPGPWRN